MLWHLPTAHHLDEKLGCVEMVRKERLGESNQKRMAKQTLEKTE